MTERALEREPILSLLKKYSIPAIISMLVSAVYNITDQIFIGHVIGVVGNAATNVVFPTVTFSTATAQLIAGGCAANFNLYLGGKEPEESKKYLGNGLLSLVAAGIIYLIILLVFKRQVLLLGGATPTVYDTANAYLSITMFGLPFLLFINGSSTLIRADGGPKYAMYSVLIGAIVNVVLDWYFMFQLRWGIRGAAFATVIGQVVSCVLCVRYFFHFKNFPLTRDIFRWRPTYALSNIKLGLPNFINLFMLAVVNVMMNNSLTYYGKQTVYGSDIPLAVSGIVIKLNSILTSLTVGLAQGTQPILSYNKGAKNYRRVKDTYVTAMKITLGISFAAFLCFQLFPDRIIGIFGGGSREYFDFGRDYLRIFMFMVMVFGLQPLSINYFTAVGEVKQGLLLSVSRQGLFFIPLLLILPKFFGLDGILYTGPIADFCAFLLSITLVWKNFKKMGVA